MNMTHYMELLADNQPWNLLIFMAIPVVLAETMAITELYILYTRRLNGPVHALNRLAGIVVGLYFIGVIYYLTKNAVLPLTANGQWRTFIDVVAVISYLVSGLPLVWIALQELGLVNRRLNTEAKLKVHAVCVALFLVFGHVAMIAGMTDPGLFGYTGEGHGHGAMGAPHEAAPAPEAKPEGMPMPAHKH
ncbi:MAG: hypothetical protein RL559_1171 [Pseudomonadota bacterium]|jgi:hypothetical protein